MIYLIIVLVSFLFQGQPVVGSSAGGTLNSVKWDHRVLAYVIASESERASIERSLDRWSYEIEDRELLFVNLGEIELETRHGMAISSEEKVMWREFWNMELSESRFVLIGKDGGAKAFQKGQLLIPLFFDFIDAMPMRMIEMRERGVLSQ